MRLARWSDLVAKIEADGGPITPHPDPETARLLAENPPADRPPAQEPKYDTRETERRIDVDEPPAAAQPAELTPEPETVETPAENERGIMTVDEARTELGFGIPEMTVLPLTEEQKAQLRAEFERARQLLAGITIEPADSRPTERVPNPPSRRGWRRLFRRTA